MKSLVLTGAAMVACWLLLLMLAPIASRRGLVDHPGGRKDHADPTPLVGGVAIGLTLLAGLMLIAPANALPLACCVCTILAIGVADDIHEIKPLPKFVGQIVACAIMVIAANVELHNVGNLLGFGVIGSWWLTAPVTVFATIGVINAVNMADGVDGNAGLVAFVALITDAWIARASGLWEQYQTLLVIAGATAGFLLLNLRHPGQTRARVFLGDAGSMLLGFLLAWFAIDLSTASGAPDRSLPPICALWIVVIPLCDCVSLMARRLWAGSSPFHPDRQHLHHALLEAGLSVSQCNLVMAVASGFCAMVGILGWHYAVPEPVLFGSFFVLFFAYHLFMVRHFRNRDVMTAGMSRAPRAD